jgi:hypothetical protein
MTRRPFVAFALLVTLVVNAACASSGDPGFVGLVLEPGRRADVVRTQAAAFKRGTSVVITLAEGWRLTGVLQEVSGDTIVVRPPTRIPVPGQVLQLRDIVWIEKAPMETRNKVLMWIGILVGGTMGLGAAVAAAGGV